MASKRKTREQVRGCPNLTETLTYLKQFGALISRPRRTGEIVCSHPAYGAVRANGRRKDTPRALLAMLRWLQRAREVRS